MCVTSAFPPTDTAARDGEVQPKAMATRKMRNWRARLLTMARRCAARVNEYLSLRPVWSGPARYFFAGGLGAAFTADAARLWPSD